MKGSPLYVRFFVPDGVYQTMLTANTILRKPARIALRSHILLINNKIIVNNNKILLFYGKRCAILKSNQSGP